jgi:hypothetical protein
VESQGIGLEDGQEKETLISQFQQLPSNVQRLIIGIAFLAFLVGLTVLREKILAVIETRSDESQVEHSGGI